MMTIKQFATLCGCNTQTLRYYDKIGLLKPVKVDPWSGYRYYEKTQAIDYVKIKNFQGADFTIGEIKSLLTLSDQQVCAAFDQKLHRQQQKLERIKEIKESYLTEKNNMEKLIENVTDYLLHVLSDWEILREFGLSPEEAPTVIAKLRDYLSQSARAHLPTAPDVHMIVNDQVVRGADRVADVFSALKEKGYGDTVFLGDETIKEEDAFSAEKAERVWECNGWCYVHEFIGKIPPMVPDYHYCFSFRLTEEKYTESLEFPMFMIAAMLPKMGAEGISMGCSVERSEDAQNHFALLRNNTQ